MSDRAIARFAHKRGMLISNLIKQLTRYWSQATGPRQIELTDVRLKHNVEYLLFSDNAQIRRAE